MVSVPYWKKMTALIGETVVMYLVQQKNCSCVTETPKKALLLAKWEICYAHRAWSTLDNTALIVLRETQSAGPAVALHTKSKNCPGWS